MDAASRFPSVGIDGPAGAGKSTVARRVAERLGFLFVDTGAMYRAVTLAAMRAGTPLEDDAAMGAVARACTITFSPDGTAVFLDGEDVSAAIRTPELTRNIRHAASAPSVRAVLVARQQSMARERPVVMEGRDITTVVIPGAKWLFYLDASVECRVRRRLADLVASGQKADPEELRLDIVARDQSDFNRAVGPLCRTPEQVYLDTSGMTADAVIAAIIDRVRADGA